MADTLSEIAHWIRGSIDWDALAKASAPQVGVPVSSHPNFRIGDNVVTSKYSKALPGYRGTIIAYDLLFNTFLVDIELSAASRVTATFEEFELRPAPVTSSTQQAMDASALSRASAASGTLAASKKTEQLGLPNGWYVDQNAWVDDKQRATWKAEGKCETCGELLPMSIHGLGECPKHPKQLPPDFKQ
jgi:hypothetical protein